METLQRTTPYEVITNRILALLEQGTVPWHRPWDSTMGMPRNLFSQRSYKGINVWLLTAMGYASPFWATFHQVKAAGGSVRKGARGVPVVFWKVYNHENSETGEAEKRFVLRQYTVFNAAQLDGVAVPEITVLAHRFTPIERCAHLVNTMPQRPTILHGHQRACYTLATDTLHLPRLAHHYRVISYHRRGFAGSSRAHAPFTIAQQAADGRALLQHLGIPRAHVAGHSYGAAIAMQWALDAPTAIQSLALLEPPLVASIPSGPTFWDGIASIRQQLYDPGDKAGAIEAFATAVVGPNYRQIITQFLPPGALELAVTDLDTFFQVELPALQQWRVTAEEATRIHQPVLAVVGTETAPIFRESHELLKQWMPQAEELVVPQATHALQYMQPSAVAEGLARFLARHPL